MSTDTAAADPAGPRDGARALAYRSLAVTVVTLALAYGVWYAYSVFLVALLRTFGWSRSVLAGAFSVFTLVHGAANPVLGWLSDRVGPRGVIATGGVILAVALWLDSLVETPWQLYLAFGALTAVGVATAGWTPAVVLVQAQCSERLGLALGIAGAGIGLGILVVVPLCQALIDAFGWRWAFRAIAVACGLWIVPGTLLGLRAPPAATVPRGASGPAPRLPGPAGAGLSLAVALGTSPFWLIAAAKLFGNICSQALHVHQAAFLVDHGLTPMVAASVVSVVGGASIVGKTAGGWLSDLLRRESVFVLGMAAMILSVGVLLATGAWPTAWLAYGYAVLFGMGYSATASLIPAMMSDRFRGRSFGAIFGVSQIGSSIGSALGAWLAGWLFDGTGSYTLPFVLAAAAAVIAAGTGWSARPPARGSAPAPAASAPAS
jgi:MFS family permease